MVKKPGCKHQWDEEHNCQPAFRNEYHCDDCDMSWSDTWSATSDDDCPECGIPYTPVSSTVVAPCACEVLR